MKPPFPQILSAVDTLVLASPTHMRLINVARPSFTAYTGTEVIHTFGNKPRLLVDGRPQFAEVAILRAFQAEGWEGRWLETYPYRRNPRHWNAWHPDGPRAQVHVPITVPWVNDRLHAVAKANGSAFSGCWDVVAWKEERLVFAESKEQKKDRMRSTQLRWLEAALQCGCAVEDFLVVEWSLT